MGTPTRTRKLIDLPVSVLMQPRVEDTSEVEVKMKQIMKMSGLLTINGIVSVIWGLRWCLIVLMDLFLSFRSIKQN